jgi:hypothetical protein
VLKKLLAICILFAAMSGAFGACVVGTTTGKRVTLRTEARSEGGGTFTNALGWTVTLAQARLTVGALYYFDGAPVASAPFSLSFPRRAFAHPGHHHPGDARGEMTSPASVDLLAPVVSLPDGQGIDGAVRSARVVLAAGEGGRAVVVRGVARKDAASVPFSAYGLLADLPDGSVDGCAFAAEVEADGLVTITIKPSVWLDQVDFAAVDGDLASSEVAQGAFVRGLRRCAAFAFAYRSL